MAKKSGFKNNNVLLGKWIRQQIEAGGGRLPTPEELKKACALVGISPSSLVRPGLAKYALRPGLDPTAHAEYRDAFNRLFGQQEDVLDLNPSIDPPNS